jgi:hypothetical protein
VVVFSSWYFSGKAYECSIRRGAYEWERTIMQTVLPVFGVGQKV